MSEFDPHDLCAQFIKADLESAEAIDKMMDQGFGEALVNSLAHAEQYGMVILAAQLDSVKQLARSLGVGLSFTQQADGAPVFVASQGDQHLQFETLAELDTYLASLQSQNQGWRN